MFVGKLFVLKIVIFNTNNLPTNMLSSIPIKYK